MMESISTWDEAVMSTIISPRGCVAVVQHRVTWRPSLLAVSLATIRRLLRPRPTEKIQ